MIEIAEILKVRKSQHGDFTDHAAVTVQLKGIMERRPEWHRLSDCQKEALHMIVHKIGRIMAGNPNHHDHWDDIAGYATLVSQRLPQVSAQAPAAEAEK